MLIVALCFAVLGAIIGSFVGAAVLRLPAGRGIVMGRSACDACDITLGPTELVPILSFAVQRGRCRHCHAKIAINQLVAEIACAACGLVAAWAAVGVVQAALWSLFAWTLVALALLDARHHWLPDALTLPMILVGLACSTAIPLPTLIDRLIGAIAGFMVLEGLRRAYRHLRRLDGLGGGDPKLLAAIGAWLGVTWLPWVVVLAGILGLSWVGLKRLLRRPISRFDRLPLGTFLSIAAVLLMPFAASGMDGVIPPM